jgi:lipopolysaccharide/colanic/teichoic acid biosynthesis glycosyltransferase
MYAHCLKRVLDFFCALAAICCLSPLLVFLTVVGAYKMKGNPFFTQPRPGKDEKIFRLVKFRTMTNEKDANGKLLPDDVRLTAYGKFLRSTSLDELPELFNILKGDMAVIGPRPQLVRDMVFMTPEQRKRHTVRQGLSGLAQINGRNAVTWETKIAYDLEYIKKITFLGDVKIILTTLNKAFIKRSDITEENCDTATDLGDYLLASGRITREEYDRGQEEAKKLIAEAG